MSVAQIRGVSWKGRREAEESSWVSQCCIANLAKILKFSGLEQ